MEKIVESFELYGKQYRFETGELAKQASGAVLVTQGDTTCLVTAVISNQEKDYDFFPLTVDYMEKLYAVGRIPGGYLKREGKASNKGTLTARMIDRPIRPMFAEGFKQEVHVVATTFVVDGENQPDALCVAGASAALMLADAPFEGPVACVRVGRNPETGDFIVNPTYQEAETSDLDLTIAGGKDFISMVEAGAQEVLGSRHACCSGIRPDGHQPLLRSRAALPGQVHHYAARMAHPSSGSVHRRTRECALRRDVCSPEGC